MKKFKCNWDIYRAAIWREWGEYLHPIQDIQTLPLHSLIGIENQKQKLLSNTQAFLEDKPASHTLLWGARGMGKSSLAYSIFSHFLSLRTIELPTESLKILPALIDTLREIPYYFIVFCDDLSFDAPNSSYKILKNTLEGSLEKFPHNILIYATSNHRHLIKETHSQNQNLYYAEIYAQDSIDESMSLSDRFGLHIGFYASNVSQYKQQVQFYFGEDHFNENLFSQALVFASAKGSKNGRIAKQFYIAYCNGTL